MYQKVIDEIATELGVSDQCATDIWYLRSRARWTQRAEDELVRRDKAGEPLPNICEWPEEGSEFRDFSMKEYVEDLTKQYESE